jgi:hypothetical protein
VTTSERRNGGPAPIQEALASLMREAGIRAQRPDLRVFAAWEESAGPALAKRAVPVRFARGELTVEIESAAHLHELKAFTGELVRANVNRRLGSETVRRVVYKLRG